MEDLNFEKAPTFLVRSDDNDNGGKAPTAGTRCGAARPQDYTIPKPLNPWDRRVCLNIFVQNI